MKKLFTLITLLISMLSFSQTSISIIPTSSNIKKYHELQELETMNKGELLSLYTERIKTLVNILPYIALTTKPGVTTKDLGIPNTDNNKSILKQQEKTKSFLEDTINFQKEITPYADKKDLIKSIIYYEDMLKALNMLDE